MYVFSIYVYPIIIHYKEIYPANSFMTVHIHNGIYHSLHI